MSLGWFNPIEPSNHTITDVLRSLPWFCGSSTLPKLRSSKGCKIKERTFGYFYTTTGKVWASLGQFDLTLWRCRHTGKVQVSSGQFDSTEPLGQFDLFCHGDSYSTYWYNAIIIGPSRKQSVQALSPDISFPAEWCRKRRRISFPVYGRTGLISGKKPQACQLLMWFSTVCKLWNDHVCQHGDARMIQLPMCIYLSQIKTWSCLVSRYRYCVYIIREEEHQDEENKCRADSVRNSMTHSLFRR